MIEIFPEVLHVLQAHRETQHRLAETMLIFEHETDHRWPVLLDFEDDQP